MAIKNMNFTFGKCTDCGKVVKIDVGAIIENIHCDCETLKQKEEEKPRTRRRKADEDAA